MTALRPILLDCGLTEDIKWRIPWYSLSVEPPVELVLVEELQNRLDGDPALRAAFETLTPGRQREYNLYFSSAKQAKTREARIEKYSQKILDSKGFRDR